MVFEGSHPLADETEEWNPDATQCKWFKRTMALEAGQVMPLALDSIKLITFDNLDAFFDEFIADE